MAEKRYYWLKLKEDYFNSPKIKKLRNIAGGDTYTIIYLKMQLLSVSNGGIISFEGIEDNFEKELSLKLDEQLEDVQLTLAYLKQQGLVETNNEYYLFIEACNNIGSESQSAERVRRFREKQNNISLPCNDSVTQVKRNSISISNSKSNSNINNYKEIIDYLNNKINSNYKYTTKKTQSLINARLKEKFTIDDFKKVIDNMCFKWKGTEYEQYLRPETLFGTKFEGYLNLKIHSQLTETKETEDTELVTIMYIDKYGGTTIEDYPRKKGQTEWTEEDKERILKEKGGKKWLG